jgi:serine/threonine-protein kinase RsbW
VTSANVTDGSLHLQVSHGVADLEDGQRRLREFLGQRGAGERGIYRAELAFDELVTNAIKYAHAGGAQHPIAVSAALAGSEIVVVIEDDGPPFNPLEAAEPEKPTSLEEAPIGGLGIKMVRMSSKAMEYERSAAGKNRVTVRIDRD